MAFYFFFLKLVSFLSPLLFVCPLSTTAVAAEVRDEFASTRQIVHTQRLNSAQVPIEPL